MSVHVIQPGFKLSASQGFVNFFFAHPLGTARFAPEMGMLSFPGASA